MIKYIGENEFENILSFNDKLILVFGKGVNCTVCAAIEDRINKTLQPKFPDLDIYYLVLDENPNFTGHHHIFSYPTLMLFDHSDEIHREEQVIDFERLENKIAHYMKNPA